MNKINYSVDTMLIVKLADSYRKCRYFNECNREEIYNGHRWQKKWRIYKDGWICPKHAARIFWIKPKGYSKKYNDRRTKEYIKKYNERQKQRLMIFLGKKLILSFKLRKGYCSSCSNNIFNKTCKVTNSHHLFYLPIMVWACTIELCPTCHAYETNNNIKRLKMENVGQTTLN